MMVWLLLILALLYSLAWTKPTLNTTVGGMVRSCLPQFPLPEAQVPLANYTDCIKIILGFNTRFERTAQVTFSRDTWTGVRLPMRGQERNCIFDLDMYNDYRADKASSMDVASQAAKMAKQCVLVEPHTGGVAVVGKRNGIEILLHGPTTPVTVLDAGDRWDRIDCKGNTLKNGTIPNITQNETSIGLQDCAQTCSGFKYLTIWSGTQYVRSP